VQEITKTSDPIVSHIKVPIFTAYLAALTTNPHRFLEAAHELRLKPPIAEARQLLIELEQLVEDGDRRSFVTAVNRLRRELDNVSKRLLSEYGVAAPQGIPLSVITSVMNVILRLKTGIELPDFGLRIPLPAALSRIADRRGFKATFRSVVDELVCIERLGELHDLIVSAVVRDDGADYFAIQQEHARFRGRDSSVKRWM
jgi:hypothetical protein